MKAINERLQEGLDHFMKNKSWRSIYEDAPEGWRKGVDKEEDIVFFAYTGKTNKENMIDKKEWKAPHKPFEGADGYEKAQQVRDDFINNLNGKTND